MTATATAPPPTTSAKGLGQHLTFRLQDEEYGIDILKVQEIRGLSRITPIPNSLPHIRGVINLRGAVVPVVDLRIRFNMSDEGDEKSAVIIVVNIGARVVGLIVSAVSDVVNFNSDDVQPPPEFGERVDTSFIVGMAKHNETLVLLLDIDRLLGDDTASVV